jgi:hypothetical protein
MRVVCVSEVIERLAELTIVATECLILEITQQSRYSRPGTQARSRTTFADVLLAVANAGRIECYCHARRYSLLAA